MSDFQLTMQNLTIFQTFKLQATFEVFSMTWHPLLPLLAQLSREWRDETKNYWRQVLTAVERCDISVIYWPSTREKLSKALPYRSTSYYRSLHLDSCLGSFLKGECSEQENLDAIRTCFLYGWPQTASKIAKHCKLAQVNEQTDVCKCRKLCARQCFNIAAGKRSADLIEIACRLFVIQREDVIQALEQMCAYGYKGIACLLASEFHCTVEDLRGRNNYALFYAMFNDHLPIVQWLLRMFAFTASEVEDVLTRILDKNTHGKMTSENTIRFVREFVEEKKSLFTDRLC